MPPKPLYVLFRHSIIAKDWAIRHSDGKLYLRFGRTDQMVQRRVIPQDKLSRPLLEEMDYRIRQKIGRGYQKLGRAFFSDGRMILIDSGNGAVWPLHWRVSDPLPRVPFMDFVHSMAARLTGWEPSVLANVVYRKGLKVMSTNGTWNLGTQENGGLEQDLRGGGEVPAALGPVPIVILMALDRAFPKAVTFSDRHGRPLTPAVSQTDALLGRHYGVVSSLAARLGLGGTPIPIVDSSADDAAPSYWFE